MTREATNRLLEMVEEGILDRDGVILACVKYMSEDAVADMCHMNEFFEDDEDDGGITPEGRSLGHCYVIGNVNAYCPQCSKEQGVAVLDCDYDLDK